LEDNRAQSVLHHNNNFVSAPYLGGKLNQFQCRLYSKYPK
jgi:hypothetical protein